MRRTNLPYIEHPHYNENVRKSSNQYCRLQYSPPINWDHFAFETLNHSENTIRLVKEMIRIMEENEGCAETFPYEDIDDLKNDYFLDE